MSAIGLAGLKRVDEHKLQELQDRAARDDPALTETDLLWLSVLQDRYALFLEEGLKALKAAQPARSGPSPTSSTYDSNGSMSNTPSSPGGPPPSSFVGSLLGRVGGRLRGLSSGSPAAPLQQETSKLCKHWSWVADYLVIGAIPLADPSMTDPSAALIGLRDQCKDRNTTVSLVVSAMELEEAASEDLRPFATPREWETVLGTDSFVHISLPRDLHARVTTPVEDMAAVCAQVHDAIIHHGRCVYLHCKAGLSRCWAVAVCYLVAHRNMTVGEADSMLQVVRPQLKPTAAHREYVARFAEFIASQRMPLRSKEEDESKYYRVLADLLSLPPQYRQRLVRDLDQLC
jgi:hypothetical protein